jgi:ABC-type bacteriocin/lantibiotic exporter with double-glycine peptidase domain
LATILRARGIEARERDIARAAHSYRGGTEAWYLAREARARGLRATFRREAGFPGQVRWPAIVGVKVEDGLGHFIPFLGREEGRFLVGDPMIGPERLTREELERRYRFTGFALELSRPADGASR